MMEVGMVRRGRIWLALAPAMVLPLIASVFYFVLLSESPIAKVIYSATKLFTLVWPVIAFRWVLRERLPRPNWTHDGHWKALPLGLLSGLGIVGVMVLMLLTPLREVALGGAPRMVEKTRELGIFQAYFAFTFFISVIHSLLEEYYWRWFVYGQMSRVLPGAWAHVGAGAAFAAHHVVVVAQFFGWGWGFFFGAFVGVGGAIWSLMLARQKTLLGIWLSHMIVDIGCMSVGYWLMMQG